MPYEIINRGPFRNGRVLATDSKMTGEEPIWQDVNSWDAEKFRDMRGRALRFYNYYLDWNDLRPSLLDWMVSKKYSDADVVLIQSAPSFVPETIVSKLARAINRGMPEEHLEAGTNDGVVIRDRVDIALRELKAGRYNRPEKKSLSGVTPGESPANPVARMMAKVRTTVLFDLEKMLDSWISSPNEKSKPLDLQSVMEAYDTPGQATRDISDWLKLKLSEFEEADLGQCPQLNEAYEFVHGKVLRSWIEGLRSMQSQLSLYTAGKKAQRAPRKKKGKPAEKQVQKMQYMTGSKEFSLTSIPPVSIPGSKHLWVFNTKYSTLAYYTAEGPAGFTVKGTTLQGYNSKGSYIQTLRKPEVTLPIVLGKTTLQVAKALDELTTKRREPNGRINEETIILRVSDN